MSTGPSSAAAQAREALGARLREIRRDAGLTGRALAEIIGWHFSKVSRVENGGQTPSEQYIRAWCIACHAEDEIADLIASVRAIESMYVEWRRLARAGMKRMLQSSLPRYEQTKLFRIYEHDVIPGLFQTADYSAAILSYFIDFLGTPNDVEAGVQARLERQRVIYAGDRRFVTVLEERALRARIGTVETMSGQLDRVLAVMSLPRVSLGIIPATAQRTALAGTGFWIFDNKLVTVETATAGLKITQPREIRLYAKMFDQLREAAVYGPAARALIANAVTDLTNNS